MCVRFILLIQSLEQIASNGTAGGLFALVTLCSLSPSSDFLLLNRSFFLTDTRGSESGYLALAVKGIVKAKV